jgi:sec-independent protein translocase protein TatA
MFGVSLPELLLVFVVVLIVFGPDKLPEMARTLGKLAGEFRKHSNSLRREFYNSVYTPTDELRSRIVSETSQLRAISSSALSEPPPPAASRPAQPGEPAQENSSSSVTESPANAHVEQKER